MSWEDGRKRLMDLNAHTRARTLPRAGGPSVADIEAWADGLHALVDGTGCHFARAEARRRMEQYVRGLLSSVERKNSWQLAEVTGNSTPYGVQHLLGRARWDADAVRDDVRAYVTEHLGDAEGIAVLDETGFLKKGTHSVGVQRQYSGTAGRVENCQIGVFLAYASPKGHTFLDRELYLPKVWADDVDRRKQAGVPTDVTFATKPQLGQRMLQRAFDAGVPIRWVTGDEVYGGDRRLRMWLEGREQPFVLAVKSTEPLWSDGEGGVRQRPAVEIAAAVAAADWQRLSCGAGAKGPRLYDWTQVKLARLGPPRWEHWLLVRRSIRDPTDLAYYVVFTPAGTGLEALVRVAGTRWTIEECLETAKGEVGLDHYEVRKWAGWYRHITLSLLAHAYLTVTRAAAMRDEPAAGTPTTESGKKGMLLQPTPHRQEPAMPMVGSMGAYRTKQRALWG